MSRPSVAPRNLTLTEELEKLEQSITLTLQGMFRALRPRSRLQTLTASSFPEIDHNFSKAHRIVITQLRTRIHRPTSKKQKS